MNYGIRAKKQNYATDADQAELNALLDLTASIDSGIDDDKIAGTLYDEIEEIEGGSSEEDWMKEDQGKDLIVGEIAEHIEWRIDTLKDMYPFEYKENHLTLKESPSPVYLFCLCVSMIQNVSRGENRKLASFFEILSGKLFTKFFSAHAKHMHTGWPRSEQNPKNYKELSIKLRNNISSKTKEWSWQIENGLEENDAKWIKDCGVDFVTWVDFLDNRDGRLFALGQCACGNDWPTKFNDIKITKLAQWFHPLTYIECIKVFSTPYVLVDEMLKEASNDAGVVFDRIRLTIAFERFKEHFNDVTPQLNEFIEFCKNQKRAL
ncbi:hypothetical protein ACRBF7_001445 [Providencia stuartii]|uniref:hypothetical protein n=1 Tax=Providencia stuartii TaxID=588 RepID=UPI000C9B63B1|nr:hypothetical protein [Providencia stuartii]SUC47010.1 Uncharacterised protein [Providencia stuartii]HEM8214880.1 hypothetical protein [Providencia stuartii]